MNNEKTMTIKEYLLSNICSFTLSDRLINQIKELNIKFDSPRSEDLAWHEIDAWNPTDPESHETRVEKFVRKIAER